MLHICLLAESNFSNSQDMGRHTRFDELFKYAVDLCFSTVPYASNGCCASTM